MEKVMLKFYIGVFCVITIIIFGVISSNGQGNCNDGWTSYSIGKQGACSHHGGIKDDNAGAMILVALLGGGIGTFIVFAIIVSIIDWYDEMRSKMWQRLRRIKRRFKKQD